jgi:hypothetical protein
VKPHNCVEVIKSYAEKFKEGNGDEDFLHHLEKYTADNRKGELEFYILELASLGLVKPHQRNRKTGASSTVYISTNIGIKFLSFVINE